MKKTVLVSMAVFITAWLITSCAPSMKQYEPLKDPKIVKKADQKVIYIELKGDPNKMGGAVASLYQIYFKLPIKGKKMVAPRARWPKPFNTPRDEWVGIWALPVPDSVTSLPVLKEKTAYEIKLGTWEYGDVAEILHKGPYKTEIPAIEKLKAFIQSSGYGIAGIHEEEYLIGPGMFGPGNPEKYYTIIRYPVKKK